MNYRAFKKNISRRFKYANLLSSAEYPRTKFVMYTRGRTGSTLLTELLNCHPQIFCDVEIFNLIYSLSKVRYPLPYIRSCSKRATFNRKTTYGFKVKISQMIFEHGYENYTDLLESLSREGWKFIYLKRLNHLRHKISNFMTTRTNIFHLRNGDKYEYRINVNCSELMRGIKYSEEVASMESESLKNIPHLELIYENDILDNLKHQKTADKVFDFLGLQSVPVKTDYKKIIPEKLEEIVINYDEVRCMLEGTKYENFLNG